MSVADAAGTGDRRRTLEAVRDRLAASLDVVDERYVAPLAKQLADVVRELDSLPNGSEETDLDRIRARRAARGAAASGQ